MVRKIVNIVLALMTIVFVTLGLIEKAELKKLNNLVADKQNDLTIIENSTEQKAQQSQKLGEELEAVKNSSSALVEVYDKWKKYNQDLVDRLP